MVGWLLSSRGNINWAVLFDMPFVRMADEGLDGSSVQDGESEC